VINGDAMQMYDGLPIITNKITPEEQRGVPHHLLGCVQLDEEPWRVGKFVKSARAIIRDIHARKRVPILVGGTHYYTQSLLFSDQLADGDAEAEQAAQEEEQGSAHKWPILEASTAEILHKLREVDPIMADRWHPDDRRKIRRSLEIWLQTGRKASEIYQAQQREMRETYGVEEMKNDGDDTQSPRPRLRFPTLFLWVHTPSESLKRRLGRRVDTMLDSGLLDEVLGLCTFLKSQAAQQHAPIDQTRGIWVSIGYKEFAPYCAALQDTASTSRILERLKAQGVERTKIATRQYAKRQVKWIQSKLLSAVREAGSLEHIFVLDSSLTSPTTWEETVSTPAEQITASFLADEQLPAAEDVCTLAGDLLRADREDLSRRRDLWERRTCELCGVTAITALEWEKHAEGRKHKMTVRAHNRRASAGQLEVQQQQPDGESAGT